MNPHTLYQAAQKEITEAVTKTYAANLLQYIATRTPAIAFVAAPSNGPAMGPNIFDDTYWIAGCASASVPHLSMKRIVLAASQNIASTNMTMNQR